MRFVLLVLAMACLATGCSVTGKSHTEAFGDCLKDEDAFVQTALDQEGIQIDEGLTVDGGLLARLDGEEALVMVLDSHESARNFAPDWEGFGVVKRFGSVVVQADRDRTRLLEVLETCARETD